MKDYFKIRRMLGKDYHLNVNYDGEKYEWKLFKIYSDPSLYYHKDNKAIMTSEKNTEKELLKFAKKHRKYDFEIIHNIKRNIEVNIILILSIANIWLKNPLIRYTGAVLDIYIIIDMIIDFIIGNHNFKIVQNELREKMRLLLNFENDEDEKNDD